jgi:hypothetical protein
MLDKNHPCVNDLIFSRNDLSRWLLSLSDTQCRVTVVKKAGVKAPAKRLFQVIDPVCFAEVRRRVSGLERLRDKLTELEVDFKANQGLWLPMVADEDAGDYQFNLMASPSWNTRKVAAGQLVDEAHPNERDKVTLQVSKIGEARPVKMVRESGKAYRVAVRNHDAERRVQSLHEFAVILGAQVIVNLPDRRPRAKRVDAWRGVTPPLFTFSGQKERFWMVYPE